MTKSALPNSAPRSLGLDALRTLAILGMMAAHTSRMIEFDFRPVWSVWVLLLEPIIPSLFLLMVGISLTLSLQKFREKNAGASTRHPARVWYLRQVRRAGILWAIGCVFYLLELGPRFPDFLTASGVLATIAYAIIGVGALLLIPYKEWAIGVALCVGLAVFIGLDLAGQRVFAVNTGNAPFLPLWLFALAGALWALLRRRVPRAVFWAGLVGAGLAAYLIFYFGLDALFTKPFGRSDAGRMLAPPWFIAGEERRVGYYNLRPLLALCCLGLHLGALSLLGLVDRVGRSTATRLFPLFVLGRHSLEAYVGHLTLLALLVVVYGMRPLKTAAQGNAVLAGLIVTVTALLLWRERIKFVRQNKLSTQ